MKSTELNVSYIRYLSTLDVALWIAFDSSSVVLVRKENSDSIVCKILKAADTYIIPCIDDLTEEEYFQLSVVVDVDIKLLHSIQKYSYDVINANGMNVENFDMDCYHLQDIVEFRY